MDWEAGKRYRIVYESDSGRITERTIELRRMSQSRDGRVFLHAYCYLRDEERTFREDRILDCAAVDTAEKPAYYPAFRIASPPLEPSVPARVLARPSQPLVAPVAQPPRDRTTSFAAAAAPAFTSTASSAGSAVDGRKALGRFLGVVVGVVFFLAIGKSGLAGGRRSPAPAWASAGAVTASRAASVVKPSPPPKPAIEEALVGGHVLRTIRTGGVERFEVPDLGITTADKREAIASIRLPAFIEATGLTDPALIGEYLEADLNHSGRLSFDELSVFQRSTYHRFRYESNDRALRPDAFLAAGGGDCDDFALYTAGLLRFWGWDPYLGSLGPSGGGTGHAVCLSYEEGSIPANFAYFQVKAWTTEDGTDLKSGIYVPIDYDLVGGLTNAAKKSWKLRSIWIPEKAWGLSM